MISAALILHKGVAIGDIGQHADLNTPDGLPAITPSLTRFYMVKLQDDDL